MKQEKLCESEDMTERDYTQWYQDPIKEMQFKKEMEELGAANTQKMWAELEKRTKHVNDERAELYITANERQVGGAHYKAMPIQPWDIIDLGPKEQAIGFYRYNALKYIMRAGEKGPAKQDYEKAQHYLEKLLEILE